MYVSIGEFPYDFVFNPNNDLMYVGNLNSYDVSVIDTASNTVIDTIDVGVIPISLKFNPSNNNIYVANRASNDVSVIDSSTNTVIETIEVGNHPNFLELNPSNNNIYVANYHGTTVSVIDTASNTVIDTIEVGNAPYSLEYNPVNNNIYVANSGSKDISIIDGNNNTVIDTIEVENSPIAIEFNPGNNNLYIANFGSNYVSVIGNPSPIADAGTNQTVNSGDIVQLDGTGSSANGGSPIVSYQWTQTSGPPVILSDSTAVNPTFTAPEVQSQEDIVFQLIVANEQGVESEPDSVTITVNPVIPPIANAGPDQAVDSGATVQLDGTGSSANGGSPIVSYQWTQTSGPTVTLDDPTSATPSFTAPQTEVQENIVFELVVTNEQGAESQPDSVTIAVNSVTPVPPLDGIIGSGNNINIQVQENSGNNTIGQAGSGSGQMYSDESIFQGQSTEQDSNVTS